MGHSQAPPATEPGTLRDAHHFTAAVFAGQTSIVPPVMERGSFLFEQIRVGRLQGIVHRLSLDGTADTVFDVSRIVRPFELADRTPYIQAFTSSADGEVFILTQWFKSRAGSLQNVLHFDSSGTFREAITLDAPFMQVLSMARFLDGRMLLVAGDMSGAGVTGVSLLLFARDGKLLSRNLLRELNAGEAETALKERMQVAAALGEQLRRQAASSDDAKPAEAAHQPPVTTHLGKDMDRLYFNTHVTSGSDGAVYFVRPDRPDKLYKVESDGTITELALKRTSKPDGASPVENLQVLDGEVALFSVAYSQSAISPGRNSIAKVCVDTFHLANGQQTGAYTGDAKALGAMALGFTPQGASFLTYRRDADPPVWEIVFATF